MLVNGIHRMGKINWYVNRIATRSETERLLKTPASPILDLDAWALMLGEDSHTRNVLTVTSRVCHPELADSEALGGI